MSGNSSIKISNTQIKLYPDPTDTLISWSNVSSNVVQIPVTSVFNGGNTPLYANQLVITHTNTPSNSTQNTISNMFWSDGNYLYYAVSNNVIKRCLLSSF